MEELHKVNELFAEQIKEFQDRINESFEPFIELAEKIKISQEGFKVFSDFKIPILQIEKEWFKHGITKWDASESSNV